MQEVFLQQQHWPKWCQGMWRCYRRVSALFVQYFWTSVSDLQAWTLWKSSAPGLQTYTFQYTSLFSIQLFSAQDQKETDRFFYCCFNVKLIVSEKEHKTWKGRKIAQHHSWRKLFEMTHTACFVDSTHLQIIDYHANSPGNWLACVFVILNCF